MKIFPVEGLPIIKKGNDLGKLICKTTEQQGNPLEEGDIIVVTHVIVSRAEGNIVDLDEVTPSRFAQNIAEHQNRDSSLVEMILQESQAVIRMRDRHLIAETKHGFICANAGVDLSNVPGERNVALLPADPDSSAKRIQRRIKDLKNIHVAVIVSDTHGRALRRGAINVAIGIAGMKPIKDYRNKNDLFSYRLRVKQTAIADELCSAAELVMGQAGEGIPVAVIRGYSYEMAKKPTVKDLLWPREKALFF